MATIIKSESVNDSSGVQMRKVAFDLNDMAGQADEYLGAVRGEAAKIIEAARAESDAIREQATEAGRKSAEAAIDRILDQKVAQQMKTLQPALAAAVAQVDDSRQEWLQHWENSVVELAAAMAARIVRREIQEQPEIPLTWIRESLQLCGNAARIVVRLHPSEHETLGPQVEQLAQTFSPAASATILADPTVTMGGCRVDTEFGSIDQQIESQLSRLAQELS